MGIHALVPVEEALHINGITDVQCLYSLIDIGPGSGEIRLNGEGIYIAVQGNLEVQVVAVCAGAVTVIPANAMEKSNLFNLFYLSLLV